MTSDVQSFQRPNKNTPPLYVWLGFESWHLYRFQKRNILVWVNTHLRKKTYLNLKINQKFNSLHWNKCDIFQMKIDIIGFIENTCRKVTPRKPLCPSDVDDSHSENQASTNYSFAHLWGLIDLFWAHITPELILVHPPCWSELKNSYTFSGRNHQWQLTYSSQILTSMVETANESCNYFIFFEKDISFPA